jgi:hypothetical protein
VQADKSKDVNERVYGGGPLPITTASADTKKEQDVKGNTQRKGISHRARDGLIWSKNVGFSTVLENVDNALELVSAQDHAL